MNHSTPGLPVYHQLPEFTQIYAHRVSDAIHPSHPLSSPSPPAPNPSQHQGLFQWVNTWHEVAKVLEFQLQHQSFHPGLISFRMDKLDLLAVQRPLKSLPQHHSSRASIFRRSDFFTVQLSHPYMTTQVRLTLSTFPMAIHLNTISVISQSHPYLPGEILHDCDHLTFPTMAIFPLVYLWLFDDNFSRINSSQENY